VRAAPAAPRGIIATSYASFVLIGWSSLLVPSLIRVIKGDFGQSDAGFGVLYLVSAALFATGALSSGLLADRIDRRAILPAAALLLATGLAGQALAPAWPVFVVGVALAGAGAGTLDAGVNGVVMDLSVTGHGSALSRLHLFYSVGALAAPLVVGSLVDAGVEWRQLVAASGVAALAVALPLRAVGAVPARHRAPRPDMADPAPAGGAEASAAPNAPCAPDAPYAPDAPAAPHAPAAPPATGGPAAGAARPDLRLPLAALGVAIACYVATEAGVSSWLVAFLSDEPMAVATFALGMFWTGHAAGRLVASRVADRFHPAPFATSCVLFGAAALAAAVVGPRGGLQVALFAAVGFGLGPVYPMIMTVAGAFCPHRAASVSGLLTAAGVAGSVVYPPLMGFVSDAAGLGAGMIGAAVLAVVCGLAVMAAGRSATRRSGTGRAHHGRNAQVS